MDEQSQPVPQFPAFPQGITRIHPKQQGPLNKMISKALTSKLARHPKTGIKTNQTVKFGHRKQQQKWKRQLPYY